MVALAVVAWVVAGAVGWAIVMARQPDHEYWAQYGIPFICAGPITLAAVITFYVFRKGDA